MLLALGFLPLAIPLPVAAWIALAAVAGLALPVVLSLVFQRVQLLCPPNLLTEANAWVVTAFGLSAAIAALLAGVVTDHQGHATAIPTIVLTAAAFTTVVCLLSHRDEPSSPAGG